VVRVRVWGRVNDKVSVRVGVPIIGIIITVGTGVKVRGRIRVPSGVGIGVRVKDPVGGVVQVRI
jgi:hypothetical protein